MKNFLMLSYGTIGDFVLQLYVLESIHACAPKARIWCLATRNAEVLRVLAAPRPYLRVVPITLTSTILILLRTTLRSNIFFVPPTFTPPAMRIRALIRLLTLSTGVTVGFVGFRDRMHYTINVPFEMKRSIHENLHALLLAVGCTYHGSPHVMLREDASILKEIVTPYIAIAPFAGHPAKTLPEKRWVALLSYFQASHPGHMVVILGSPGDAESARHLVGKSGHNHTRVFCGEPFARVISLIKHTALFVGVDSGLTHVAGVLQTTSVIIGNLRNPAWLPTYNPEATILFESKNCQCRGDKTGRCIYEIDGKQYLRCMIDIPQERIYEKIDNAILITHAKTHA